MLVGREKWGMQMIKWYLYSLPIPKAKAGAGLVSVKDENYSSLLLSDQPPQGPFQQLCRLGVQHVLWPTSVLEAVMAVAQNCAVESSVPRVNQNYGT